MNEILYLLEMMNGAEGISDIEDKAALSQGFMVPDVNVGKDMSIQNRRFV